MATSSSAAVTTPNVFIPTPPVLDLTDHLQAASKWRTWEERWKAFAAVTIRAIRRVLDGVVHINNQRRNTQNGERLAI